MANFTIGENQVELTDDEAMNLLIKFRYTFGWSGTEFTRTDVEDTVGRPITEEEWENIQSSYYWHKGIMESSTAAGWDNVQEAIEEVGIS